MSSTRSGAAIPQPTGRARVHAWLLLAAASTAVLAIARWLTPDPHGHGTHTQLGLPPCLFLELTGLPCPACGLTTCFALMARGELRAALQVHAVGVLLFAGVAAAPLFAMWGCVRGRPCFETCARMQLPRAILALACAALLQWGVRVARLLLG